MTETECRRAIRTACVLQRVAGPNEAQFWDGYGQGLVAYQRHLQGESLATDQVHVDSLAQSCDENIPSRLFGTGYRSGFDGDLFHVAAVKWKELEIEDEPPRPGRPEGSLKMNAMRGQIPAIRCDEELAVWVEQEAGKMGISVSAYVRMSLMGLMRASKES